MKASKSLLVLALLGAALKSYPQTQSHPKPFNTTFYLNSNWELTTKENATFVRRAYFDLTDMVFDGVYQDYTKDSALLEEGIYDHGQRVGLQYEYFRNRAVKSCIEFHGYEFNIWEMTNPGVDTVRRGTGKFKIPYLYLSGPVAQPVWKQGTVEGAFKFGKRSGTWLYKEAGNEQTDEELYENGKLVKRTHHSEGTTVELDYVKQILISPNAIFTESLAFDHGNFQFLNDVFEQQFIYPQNFSRNLTFAGGLKRFLLLMAQNSGMTEGQVCLLRIRFDEHGRIRKTMVLSSAGEGNDKLALEALSAQANKFLPAIQNGRPVQSLVLIPVATGEEWVKYVMDTDLNEIISFQ